MKVYSIDCYYCKRAKVSKDGRIESCDDKDCENFSKKQKKRQEKTKKETKC